MNTVLSPAGDAFWAEVRDRTASITPVLLLERWARGAGMRSWYLLQGPADIALARRLARSGAGLTAYFSISFLKIATGEPDRWSRAAALLDELGPNDELLAFARRQQELTLEVAYISSADDLSGWLMSEASTEIWLCRYPDWPSDGPGALTAVVPDDDGVVRDHPY